MPKLNWIDALFFGVRRILAGGVEMPERPTINFVGATVTDNPAENRIDVVLGGSGLRKISPIVTSDYTASPGELVRVNAHYPVNVQLPSAFNSAMANLIIKEVGEGTEIIKISGAAGQRIDGMTTVQRSGPYCRIRLTSDGLAWVEI